ncbi:MAG: C45 family peptidase [Terriglobia bacterium]|jgi:hypothetical protein
MARRILYVAAVVGFCTLLLAARFLSQGSPGDPRLKKASRQAPRNGWTFVHLEGSPSEIGFQNGYLLAPEIAEQKAATELEATHDSKKSWSFFRDAARDMMWPHIEREYREEMEGIAEGLKARGVDMDIWDVVALNAADEWGYYISEYDKQHGVAPPPTAGAPEHCSAFVATGSYTRDGKVVIAHNDWSSYLGGERWTIIYDIVPEKGNRILMDGGPGVIDSADDFGLNSAGIVITETTISNFFGYDPNGIPEFVRARKAMQYSGSIDDFARIMEQGNNGGYANDWLVADVGRNEIASLELGLKNVTLQRKTDGYFVSANFPINGKLCSEETKFRTDDQGASPNARRVRWEQLMAENKGKIDVALAEKFLADHYDTFDKRNQPSERTLCGHVDLSPRGSQPWQGPYGIAGAVQNKATDATMARHMSLSAAAGHACGIDFNAEEHLKAYPEYSWQKPLLRDMKAYPWTTFSADEQR